MITESQKLIDTISNLRDEDLLRMVYLESEQYRPEALTYAKAEIRQRGITTEQIAHVSVGGPRPDLWLAAFGERIWKSRRTIALSLGFLGSLFWFAKANFDSYQKMYKVNCNDCYVFFGYPFYLYQTGGFAGPTRYLLGGLITDVAIAIIVSGSLGILVKKLTAVMTR